VHAIAELQSAEYQCGEHGSGPVVNDHVDGSEVVNMQDSRRSLSIPKIKENGTKIFSGLGGVDSGNKFGFSRRSRDSTLEFGLVGDGITTKKEDKTSDGMTSAQVCGMGSIHITNQGRERRRGKGTKRRIKDLTGKGNGGKSRDGPSTPVDDTPISSGAEVLADLLQSKVVIPMGSSAEATQESNCIANIRATKDIGISKLAKDLTIGIADVMFKSFLRRSVLGMTIK